jgi:hypothetical protein
VSPTSDPSTDKSGLIAVIGLLVTFVSVILAQFQKQQTRFWALLSVGVLTLLIGLYRPLISGLRALWCRRLNANVVSRNRSELRRLSAEAGFFLNPDVSRNDTLQGLLHELIQRQSNISLFGKVPNAGIFHEHWYYLDGRIRGNHLSAVSFHNASEELFSLVRSYTAFSVTPVFYFFASEIREVLTDNEKSKMNAFQQQYVSFLGSYITFHKRLNDEFHGLPELQVYLAKPSPL